MTLDDLFAAASMLALLAWIGLTLSPWARWVPRVLVPVVMAFLFGVAYLILIIGAPGWADGGFGSLEEVSRLFADRRMLLAGWLHYLAFDLFIGAWMVREAERLRIPHLMILLPLWTTFMLGPVGLLMFLLLRGWRGGGRAITEVAPPSASASTMHAAPHA